MRIGYALAGAGLILSSAATLAMVQPAQADAPPAQNAGIAQPVEAPRGAPMSFADLVAKLQPAVVNISTTQKVELTQRGGPGGPGGRGSGDPFEELLRRFYEQQAPEGEPVTREAQSLGSGFLISPDGYVVTNNHVVTGRDGQKAVDKITITLADRREYEAKLIGRDPLSDIALLKINGTNLPYVQFGNSQKTRVGDWVVAIGNPFGLGGSVTAGIVSAVHRNLGMGGGGRFIQTDASINMGNSGGPLFDLSGNVVGINSAIFSPTGGNIGLGFAIPAEDAVKVVDQLRSLGKVRRGWLGIVIQPVSDALAEGLGLPKNKGEIIASVTPDAPAARAGLQQGDVVLKVNNQEVTEDNTLSYIVSNTPIGSRIPIEVLRGDKKLTLNATLGERPSEAQLRGDKGDDEKAPSDDKDTQSSIAAARASLGFGLMELNAQVRKELELDAQTQGLVIANVSPYSDAGQKGIERGDLLLSINRQPVRTLADVARIIAATKKAGRDSVVLLIRKRGDDQPLFVGVRLMSSSR